LSSFKRRGGGAIAPVGILVGAAGLGSAIGIGSTLSATHPVVALSRYTDTATNCRVVDGDTLHCDGGRIRLLGIDAPELPGHCQRGRACAPGDPFESTRSLQDGMGDGARLRIERVGVDRYGRTLAMVEGVKGDLSCWQLAHHQAIYKPAWDDDRHVANTCPPKAR
jgi:endonuclease YncB( thermonuclease family)